MDNIERINNILEHPELYSEEELQELLLDDDSRLTFKTVTDLEAALEVESDTRQQTLGNSMSHHTPTPLWRKIAAAVVGICLLSGVAYAAAHFRAVGGKPADIFALIHAGIRKELTDEQNALTAEACENISPKHNLYLLGDVFLNAERIIGDHVLFEPFRISGSS